MTVNEALEVLSNINPDSREDIRLLIDCPHCGRSGELGSIRPMLQVTPAKIGDNSTRERKEREAELRRISMALGLCWPTTMEEIITAIRSRPQP